MPEYRIDELLAEFDLVVEHPTVAATFDNEALFADALATILEGSA